MMRFTFLLSTWFAVSVTACASTPGAKPQDMSAAEHDTMAGDAAASAARHQGEYLPAARDPNKGCGVFHVCWEDLANPTTAHQAEADQQRKMAADHRAASQALRDAEARGCAGISERDRDVSPFFHGQDLERVEPLIQEIRFQGGTGSSEETVGAVVYFRPVPGLTQELLQRIVNCHLARNAAAGHVAPEMAYCPLVPRGVAAQVRSDGDGFAVEIRSRDADAAHEVLRRARGLVKP